MYFFKTYLNISFVPITAYLSSFPAYTIMQPLLIFPPVYDQPNN